MTVVCMVSHHYRRSLLLSGLLACLSALDDAVPDGGRRSVAASRNPAIVAGIGAVLAVACVVWTSLLTTAVGTTAAVDRRPIVDGDFARAASWDRELPIVDRAKTQPRMGFHVGGIEV